MISHNCRNCGAPLDHFSSFCGYCGTPVDNWILIKPPTITITPNNLDTLKCGVVMNQDMVDIMGEEGAFGYAKDEIARRLAEELVERMDIKRTVYDPVHFAYTVIGRIRVLNESARFTTMKTTSTERREDA